MFDGKISVAVDFDKTLSYYDKWRGPLHFGHPIPAMVRCLQEHLKKGDKVTVFTDRVVDDEKTGVTADQIKKAIGDWCEANIGVWLEATNIKEGHFDIFYDDRAVQVVPNSGKRVQLRKEVLRSK